MHKAFQAETKAETEVLTHKTEARLRYLPVDLSRGRDRGIHDETRCGVRTSRGALRLRCRDRRHIPPCLILLVIVFLRRTNTRFQSLQFPPL